MSFLGLLRRRMGASHQRLRLHFDPTKRTSGQRFFSALCLSLEEQGVATDRGRGVVLFNISASLREIVKAKMGGCGVVLRVDGLYFDRLSPAFLQSFRWPLRQIFSLGLKYPRTHDLFADLANFVNQNYAAFARIVLADLLIYQSAYSRDVHARYFGKKPHKVIVNGARYVGHEGSDADERGAPIRLATIYDDWKPAKRIHDVVSFVCWCREVAGIDVELYVLGYTGAVPHCAPADTRALIETSPYIHTFPRFNSFEGHVRDALRSAHMYITFTDRDPCPNAVVEAMAHGLPVVGIASGGIPDIVGDAGVLLASGAGSGAFFGSSRYECDFPPINFEEVLRAVEHVRANLKLFRARVRRRFAEDLDIDIVARRYYDAMRELLEGDR